jgi:hypothetical protein
MIANIYEPFGEYFLSPANILERLSSGGWLGQDLSNKTDLLL